MSLLEPRRRDCSRSENVCEHSALERSVEPSVDQFIDTVEAMAMIETTIADVVGHVHTHERLPGKPNIAPVNTRIVLLKENGGDRVLPICVARGDEGFMLVAQLAGATFSRPVTEDLVARLIELSGGRIERVAIDAFRDHIFYATVTMRSGADSHGVDARPSDALNLAARLGCPVFVEPAVMDTCAIASGRPHRVLPARRRRPRCALRRGMLLIAAREPGRGWDEPLRAAAAEESGGGR